MDWPRLSGSTGNHSPLLLNDRDLHIDLLNWRSFLFAARIRVCRRHSSQGPGGFLWRPLLHSIPYRKPPRWNRSLVASCLLPSTRSTKLRADVADLCAGRIDCADWIGCAAAVYSGARGGTWTDELTDPSNIYSPGLLS